jgi:hypothetical protein
MKAMPDYRIYKVLNERIKDPSVIVTCDNDSEVREKAAQMMNGVDVEVWDGPRRVIYLQSTGAG